MSLRFIIFPARLNEVTCFEAEIKSRPNWTMRSMRQQHWGYTTVKMIIVRALTQYLSKCRVSFGIFHHVEACTNKYIYIYQQYQWISHLSFVPISTIEIAFWSEVRGPPTCRGGRGKPFRWGPQPTSTSQKHQYIVF